MAPPNTTIVVLDVRMSGEWLVGIDLQFYTIHNNFHGIKNVTLGLHFVHYGIDDLNRAGIWIDCNEGDVVVLQWDKNLGKLVRIDQDPVEQLNVSKITTNLGSIYPLMVDFQLLAAHSLKTPEMEKMSTKANGKFANFANFASKSLSNILENTLFDYINLDLVKQTLGGGTEITTMSVSKKENDQLREKIELDDKFELNYTETNVDLELKKLKPEERTARSLDKSWFINKAFHENAEATLFENVLGELQLSFFHFLTLGNFASEEQWVGMLLLILQCESLILRWNVFGRHFFKVFQSQLEVIPQEYLIETTAVVQMKIFLKAMKNLLAIFQDISWNKGACCGNLKKSGLMISAWSSLTGLLESKFGIDSSHIECDDEEDDGPVVVEC